MIIKTLKQGFRMAEAPAHEHARMAGKSNIKLLRVAFRYVWSLIRCLFEPTRTHR